MQSVGGAIVAEGVGVAGCAFVTYANKQCAQNAIRSMHQSQTMEVSDAQSLCTPAVRWYTYYVCTVCLSTCIHPLHA